MSGMPRSRVTLVLAACAKPSPPPAPQLPPITIAAPVEAKIKASMTLEVNGDANPDANGRPSPVVVHIYQLRADAMFRNVDFFALIDDAPKALAETLITRDDFYLQPGDRRTLDVTVASEAAFVGVAAEYHEFRTAEWRAVVPAPKQGLKVTVERARVVVAPIS